MPIIICETDRQSRLDAWDRVLRAGALGWPRGMGWGGRWEGGSRWGAYVNPWPIHINVCQKPLQCCKVISLQHFIYLNFFFFLKKRFLKRQVRWSGAGQLAQHKPWKEKWVGHLRSATHHDTLYVFLFQIFKQQLNFCHLQMLPSYEIICLMLS